MKRLLNYTIILSLSLVVFGCGGPTIDKDSDEFDYIEVTKKGITNYKGDPFSGTLVKNYENGQLEKKVTYKDGKEHSVYETYYKNGQLEWKVTYKDGKLHGVSESYYEDGQLEKKVTFKHGELDGVWEDYDKEGKVSSRRTYKDGIEVK